VLAQLPRICAESNFSEIPERLPIFANPKDIQKLPSQHGNFGSLGLPIFANPRGTQARGQLDAPGLLYPREFSGFRLLRSRAPDGTVPAFLFSLVGA
jgi:hypothetical protein